VPLGADLTGKCRRISLDASSLARIRKARKFDIPTRR